MAISKIILNGVTQMDVTDTTATSATVYAGEYFYGADGEKTLGTGSGGGTVEAVEKDVNFIDDYDGTIAYSYTATEFANLSAMPANPTHTGMTSQGWNWTLADAKAYVANYGKLWIGQQYVTTSGDTEIDIYLEKGRTSPYLGLAVNGSVSVDWGDETEPSTITGTSLAIQIRTLHNYPDVSANYTIKISVVSGSFSFYGGSSYPLLSKNSSTLVENRVYSNAVKFIRLGANVLLGFYAFAYLQSLEGITMPSNLQLVTLNYNYPFYACDSLETATIPQSMENTITGTFYMCYTLKRVSIPSGVAGIKSGFLYSCRCVKSISLPADITSIESTALQNCYAISTIIIPASVSDIAANAVSGCCGLKEIHFRPTTPPTVANSNAFGSLPTDCVIHVPYSADHSVLAAYRAASNYPDPNTYTYTEESA